MTAFIAAILIISSCGQAWNGKKDALFTDFWRVECPSKIDTYCFIFNF